LAHLKALETMLGHLLGRYGGWGLFAISFLDSSFLAFPFVNDLLVIKLASLHPYRAVFYSLQCTAGSVLGAYIIYEITRQGRRVLSHGSSSREKSHVWRWVERNDFVSILVASLLPPPTPFKIFAIIAGGIDMSVPRFVVALVIGRGIRFSFEAWLGVYYGAAAQAYLTKNFGWFALTMVVAVVVLAAIYRRLKHRPVHPQ
jgi:membrane protein YqaA with SNARE-associated domain